MVATALSIHDAVWPLLDAITNINAYDGEVPSTPPLDQDGRVHAYAVLYASAGNLYASGLDGAQGTLLGGGYINCVGGDPTRALWCVDKVRTGLATTVTLGGRAFPIRFRDDGTVVVRRDDDVTPPRHWVQLEFQILAP